MTDWSGTDYHRHSALQQAMAAEQLAQLTLEGGERILDVGCGDGKVTAQIAARVPRGSVLGVDPSPSMIAFASEHFAAPVVPNLRFETADARRLNYRDEFDLVVSFNALHWVHEQGAALRSIRTALKPQGRAILRFVPDGSRKSLEEFIEDVRQEARWADSFRDFGTPHIHFAPDEYRSLAEQEGFQVVRIAVEEKAWDFKTREAFMAFCRATFVAWTRCLPEEERDAFIGEVLDRYQSVIATNAMEANTFKFYQMDTVLATSP